MGPSMLPRTIRCGGRRATTVRNRSSMQLQASTRGLGGVSHLNLACPLPARSYSKRLFVIRAIPEEPKRPSRIKQSAHSNGTLTFYLSPTVQKYPEQLRAFQQFVSHPVIFLQWLQYARMKISFPQSDSVKQTRQVIAEIPLPLYTGFFPRPPMSLPQAVRLLRRRGRMESINMI